MFCVTNWITTPSKARNCLFFFSFFFIFFFIPPAAVDATLSAGRWWGTEAHTHLWVIHLICSPLPTCIINTQRDGNETSPFPSFKTRRRLRQTVGRDPLLSVLWVLLILTLHCPPPPTPRLLPDLTLQKKKKAALIPVFFFFLIRGRVCAQCVCLYLFGWGDKRLAWVR